MRSVGVLRQLVGGAAREHARRCRRPRAPSGRRRGSGPSRAELVDARAALDRACRATARSSRAISISTRRRRSGSASALRASVSLEHRDALVAAAVERVGPTTARSRAQPGRRGRCASSSASVRCSRALGSAPQRSAQPELEHDRAAHVAGRAFGERALEVDGGHVGRAAAARLASRPRAAPRRRASTRRLGEQQLRGDHVVGSAAARRIRRRLGVRGRALAGRRQLVHRGAHDRMLERDRQSGSRMPTARSSSPADAALGLGSPASSATIRWAARSPSTAAARANAPASSLSRRRRASTERRTASGPSRLTSAAWSARRLQPALGSPRAAARAGRTGCRRSPRGRRSANASSTGPVTASAASCGRRPRATAAAAG